MTTSRELDNISEEQMEAWSKLIIIDTIRGLINNGTIDPEGKDASQILKESLSFTTTLKKYGEAAFTIDHTDEILKKARNYRKRNEREYSCVFYALWIEHQINKLVDVICHQKGLTNKETEILIRDTSYRAKSTSFLHLSGFKPFYSTHVITINKIMEIRNGFIHYKWKSVNKRKEEEADAFLEKIESTVRYMKNYETKYLRQRTTREVKKMLYGPK